MSQKNQRKRTTNARRILKRIAGDDPELLGAVQAQKLNVHVRR